MAYETFKCMVCDHDVPNIPNIEYCPTCDASILDQSIVGEITEKHYAEFAKHKQEWLKRLESEKNYECEVCETPFDYSQIKTCPTCNFEYPATPRYRLSENEQVLLELKISRAEVKWLKELQKARPQILTRTANTVYDLERAIDEKATVINLMPNKYILTRTLNIDYPISFSGTGGIAEIISECDDVAINYSGNGQLHIVNVKFYNKHDKNSTILKISKGSIDIQHCVFSVLDENNQEVTKILNPDLGKFTQPKQSLKLKNNLTFSDEVQAKILEFHQQNLKYKEIADQIIALGLITSEQISGNKVKLFLTEDCENQDVESRDKLIELFKQQLNLIPKVSIQNATSYIKYNQFNNIALEILGTSQLEVAHNSFKNIPVALILKDENQSQILENTFENNQQAIVISDKAQSTIKQNRIQNNQLGFFVIQNSTPTIQQNTVQNNQIGFHVSDDANPKIENNLIQQNQQVGALFDGKSNGVFNDNLCKNNKGIGINLSGETTFTIQNNLIQANESIGIEINHKTTSKIISNIIDQNKTQGISIKNQAQPTIRENSILSSENAIILADASKALIEHNIISNHKDNAILLTQKSSATIEHNQIDNNLRAIQLQDESTGNIRLNSLVLNKLSAIRCSNLSNSEIQGNKIRQSNFGISFDDESKGFVTENHIQSHSYAGIQLSEKSNVVIKHNQIRLNDRGINVINEATGQILNNQIQSNLIFNICLNKNLTATIEQNIIENAFLNFSKSSSDLIAKNTCRFESIDKICVLAGLDRSKITDLNSFVIAIANSNNAMNEINKNQLVLDILYQHAQKKKYQNAGWQDILTGKNLIVRINCTKSGEKVNRIRLEGNQFFKTSTGFETGVDKTFKANTLVHNHLIVIDNKLDCYAQCEFEFAYFPL